MRKTFRVIRVISWSVFPVICCRLQHLFKLTTNYTNLTNFYIVS